MCRWLAYSGSPIRLEELLVKRDRSLIDQSLHSRLGATTTNGDGFGVGWYDDTATPRLYRSVHPAWNDRNLRELAAGVSSPLFFAHIRASTGTAIWAFRYSSEGDSRSLWFSTRMDALKALYPESAELASLSDETRVVVSEPLGDLPGAWNEAPESHVGIVQPGTDELRPFSPSASV